MTGEAAAVVVTGLARDLGAGVHAAPARFELSDSDFTLLLTGAPPVVAAYRDISTVAIDAGRLLLVLGGGAVRIVAEQLGQGLGTLVAELRERRARQMLDDRFIELSSTERLELVEYRSGDQHGVAQVAYHAWGVALLPLDERQPWRVIRRADVDAVAADPSTGTVTLRARTRPGIPAEPLIELPALGAHHERHRARLAGLRDAALADAAAIVGALMPDAPFDARRAAAAALIDGRPVSASELAGAWPHVEAAVLSDPTYAASYRALAERAGADTARWIALAPRRPTDASEHMAWFFVALPGGLVALELVSGGSHATYLFRGRDSLASAVSDVSESLIDTRFLREPIYLNEAALADPRHTRYRFAIAALPSLRAARSRFVGRLIHTDEESWMRSLDDAINWYATAPDDAATWPGGAPATESEGD